MKDFLSLDDFVFRSRFVDLTDEILGEALQIVNARFSGVYSLWSILPPEDANAKRELCINYLIAWYLTQNYPGSAINASGTGGIPVSMKKAGPITIKYKEMVRQEESVLSVLTTNQWGIEALTMIQSAPETYTFFA